MARFCFRRVSEQPLIIIQRHESGWGGSPWLRFMLGSSTADVCCSPWTCADCVDLLPRGSGLSVSEPHPNEALSARC